MKKRFRVTDSDEFLQIIKYKRFYNCPTLTLYVKPKKADVCRVGLSVGKKVGKAHVRNKVKRQLRGMLQECFDFNGNFDAIILVRPKFIEENYLSNKNYLESLLKKVKI